MQKPPEALQCYPRVSIALLQVPYDFFPRWPKAELVLLRESCPGRLLSLQPSSRPGTVPPPLNCPQIARCMRHLCKTADRQQEGAQGKDLTHGRGETKRQGTALPGSLPRGKQGGISPRAESSSRRGRRHLPSSQPSWQGARGCCCYDDRLHSSAPTAQEQGKK